MKQIRSFLEESWHVLRICYQKRRLAKLGLHHKNSEVRNPTFLALSIGKDTLESCYSDTNLTVKSFFHTLLNPGSY